MTRAERASGSATPPATDAAPVVRRVDGPDLRRVEGWERCRTSAPIPQFVQRRELLLDWNRGAPSAVLAEDGERVVGIAPLVRSRQRRAWHVRLRSSRPTVVSFDLDVVEVPGGGFAAPERPAVVEALLDGVLAQATSADLVSFRGVPVEAALLTAARRLGPRSGWWCTTAGASTFRHRSRLAGDTDAYFRQHLGHDTRRYLLRDVRRFDRSDHDVAVTVHRAPHEMAELVAAVAEVDARSWHADRRSAGVSPVPDVGRLSAWAALGLVRSSVLRLDGRPVAYVHAYASDGCLWVSRLAFDRTWARRSPGKVLLWHVVDDLHRDGGFTWLDLGRGTWPFKTTFAPDGHRVVDLVLCRARPRAMAAALPPVAWRKARGRTLLAVQHLPGGDRTQAWVRRNLSR